MRTQTIAILLFCAACGGDDESPPTEGSDVSSFMADYFVVFDRHDQDDILALYAPEVTAQITGLGNLDGIDEVRDQWLVPFTSAFPDYTHTVDQLDVDGQRATAAFVFRGTHQDTLLGYEATGNELVLPITGTYDVEDDAVASFTLEYNLAVVLATITPAM